jgi:asparagine synthetase A
MLTVKQIRDVFFSLLNNSMALTRIRENEMQIDKIHTKCYKLAYDDEQLGNKINANAESFNKQMEEVWKDIKQTKIDHERKFGDFFHRISSNFDNIKKLKQIAEEGKAF